MLVIASLLGARIAHVLFDGYLMDYVYLCVDPHHLAQPLPGGEACTDSSQCLAAQNQGYDIGAQCIDGGCEPERSCLRPLMFWAGGFPKFFVLVILCAGNALTHVGGAEVTIRSSNGRLSHPAIFVAGGAFGVITGTMLAKTSLPYWAVILFMISAIPFTVIAQKYRNAGESAEELCKAYNYAKKGVPVSVILFVSFLVVALRSYMGYCLPMEWKTSSLHAVLLYVAMGTGKAAGGILADAYGVKKIAILSSLLSLPFVILGNRIMIISLIGIMLFSMTMSITLALNVSVLKSAPGLAFGYTTAALTFGVIPIFFIKISSYAINSLIVSALTVICIAAMLLTIGKDEKINE